ncbi:MAG: hypothetical protein ABIK15_08585 [Pseudomonadota bacterium]
MKKKSSIWIKVVGIICLIIGSFGTLSGFQGIYLSEMMSMVKSNDSVPVLAANWMYYSSIVKIFISVFYLIVSIMILRKKASAILLFYWVAAANIVFGLLNAGVSFSMASDINVGVILWVSFGVILNIVMISVVAKGNKEEFQEI